MTAESTPAAELPWQHWAGGGGHRFGCGLETGGMPCPLPSCLGGAAAARAAQHPGRTSSAPAAFAGGFSAPLQWRWDSQWALQMQSSSCIQTEVFSSLQPQTVVYCSAQTSPFLLPASHHPRSPTSPPLFPGAAHPSQAAPPGTPVPHRPLAGLTGLAHALAFTSHLHYTVALKTGHVHR